MATLTTPKKRDESFFDKIGTLGRKKKKEGIHYIYNMIFKYVLIYSYF